MLVALLLSHAHVTAGCSKLVGAGTFDNGHYNDDDHQMNVIDRFVPGTTFWAPFAIAFDVVFTLLVIYFLYKAVRWALGRGGGAAPAAEAKGGKAKAKAQ